MAKEGKVVEVSQGGGQLPSHELEQMMVVRVESEIGGGGLQGEGGY